MSYSINGFLVITPYGEDMTQNPTDPLTQCALPQMEVVPFRNPKAIDAYLRGDAYKNALSNRYGTLLSGVTTDVMLKPAHSVLLASLDSRLVDFPFICDKQYIGADELQTLFYDATSTKNGAPTPSYYTLSHWINTAKAANHNILPEAPLNLINWFFADQHLSNETLNAHLSFSILEHQLWNNINASGSVLFSAGFYKLDAQSCNFNHTNLDFASFDHSKLRNCSLRDATLRGAAFDHCTLSAVDLTGTDLTGCTFDHVTIKNTDLSRLSESQISALKGQDITYEECELPRALTPEQHAKPSGHIVKLNQKRDPLDPTHLKRLSRQRERFPDGHGIAPLTVINGDKEHDGTTNDRGNHRSH